MMTTDFNIRYGCCSAHIENHPAVHNEYGSVRGSSFATTLESRYKNIRQPPTHKLSLYQGPAKLIGLHALA